MNVRLIALMATLFLAPLLHAQPAARAHDWCGTGAAMAAQQERLHRWLASQSGVKSSAIESGVRVVDGIHIVTADSSVLGFDHPFDLRQWSLQFKRIDDHTFETSRIAPSVDPDFGSLAHTFHAGESTPFAADLQSFTFPFGTRSLSRIYLTASNAIVTTPDPIAPLIQWHALEAVSNQRAMISPLFHSQPIGDTRLYLKQTTDAVLVTWVAAYPIQGMSYRVQARLSAAGDIAFSYDLLENIDWGTVIVTTGEEALYANGAALGSANDAVGDVAGGIRGQWRDILDVTSVQARRLGGTELIEFVLQLRGSIDRSKFATDDVFLYVIRFSSNNEIDLWLGREDAYYFVPGRGLSSAVRVDGNTVTMRVLQSHIPLATQMAQAITYDSAETLSQPMFADSAALTANLAAPGEGVESDLSALAQATRLEKPVFEAFTLPGTGLYAIFNKIKTATGLTDAQVDGMAVYENFTTNIMLLGAAAYALVGNPRADGVRAPSRRANYGRNYVAYPNLMEMNRIGYVYNIENRFAGFALAHEFAHRWLYDLAIMENGAASTVLALDGGHPAPYVNTAVAYPVSGPRNSSMMGGGNFADLGDGTFATGDLGTADGYSAHELYLMGLLAPEEVQPWFYVADANPPFGESPWLPKTSLSAERGRKFAYSRSSTRSARGSPHTTVRRRRSRCSTSSSNGPARRSPRVTFERWTVTSRHSNAASPSPRAAEERLRLR